MSTISLQFTHQMNNTKKTLIYWRDRILSVYEKVRLKRKPFIIISNNCWGYELYASARREYNTPFIGLFMMPECYIQFLENFEVYINDELTFIQKSKYHNQPKHYPIGTLGDGIEVHFLHYSSEKEAREKWDRRMSRLKSALDTGVSLYVKICDCEGCTLEHLSKFHALKFPNKLSIGLQNFDNPNHLCVPNLRNKSTDSLVDGAKLYKKRYNYFDITVWINTGIVRKSFISRICSFIS